MHDHLPLVCFIVCDSGPATHFAEFAKNLLATGKLRIDIYASELAVTKFQDLLLLDGIRLINFMLDGLKCEEKQNLAVDLINNCVNQRAQTIIVDIANKFNIKLQVAFNKLDRTSCNIRFWCYYDNPEEYVHGDYSIRSGEMIKLSQNILFANMNLINRDSKIFSLPDIQINLNNKTIQGIGYYPIEIAEKLYQRREFERNKLREKYHWNNIKYLFIYFGGNNQIYYEQAFPIFLSFLSCIDNKLCKDILFIIHQHPAAKIENRDGLLFLKWLLTNRSIQVTLSSLTSDEAQIIADGILYYQTSMAPQFALIGLPIMQVSHKIYEDVLVKHNLCEIATNSIEFMNGLKILKEKIQSSNSMQQKQLIYDAIGYRFDCFQNLQNIILDIE
ncbi:unnamed protein product [Rotaria sordida]|uniref:Uncharacterized protein n=1 Tax=Rotaria sordida TaxID=392033 RepID=A0A814ZCX8_9BILA|nr:unnamed protein product [Rotaria sordida]CAF1252527.1 unnamed protein product [Rotaria sordida]CAF3796725.1 unnamed protein product [Rotaria sordida]CAF3881870.1 unnamed protein product [Rotaria sordida]